MPISYYYNESKGLVYEKFEGDIYITDVETVISKELPQELPPGVKAVFEIKNIKLHFGITAVTPLIKILAKHSKKFYRARWAFLCTEPLFVAYLYYFKQLSKFLPISMDIFSTMDGCLAWLGITEDELNELKERIDQASTVVK